MILLKFSIPLLGGTWGSYPCHNVLFIQLSSPLEFFTFSLYTSGEPQVLRS